MGVVGCFWYYFRYNFDEGVVKMTTKGCKKKYTPIQAKFYGAEMSITKKGNVIYVDGIELFRKKKLKGL